MNIVLSKRLIPMIKEKAPKANVEVLYNAVNTYLKILIIFKRKIYFFRSFR